MKNQQSDKFIKLVKYPVDVKWVFVTEEQKLRLEYIRHHMHSVSDLLGERLMHATTNRSGWEMYCRETAGRKTHDEKVISLALAGVSVEQLTSEVRHEVDPSGLAILERLKEALSLIALSHGQEACDQSVAHIEHYISTLKSES